MRSHNDMKLIMENWRRYENELRSEDDFKYLKETKMYKRKDKNQIIESKYTVKYKEVMTFGDYILALENKKISFKEAEEIYFDTIDYEGSLLNEASLAGVGQAIKGGIQKGIDKAKQIGQTVKGAAIAGKAIVGTMAKAAANFLKKVALGALSLLGSLIKGLITAVKNPKAAIAALKGKPLTKATEILKALLPKVIQYIKDNKWKIIATIAIVAIIAFAAATIIGTTYAVAYPAVKIIHTCGGAAAQAGSAAVKGTKALMAMKAGGAGLAAGAAQAAAGAALQKEFKKSSKMLLEVDPISYAATGAGAVCKMVAGITVQSVTDLLKNPEACNAAIGILNQAGTTITTTVKTVIDQAQSSTEAGLSASSDEQSIQVLAGKSELVRAKAIAILKHASQGGWDEDFLKSQIEDDSEVQKLVYEATQMLKNSGCTDPEKFSALAEIGNHTVVKEAFNIKSEFISQTLQNSTGFFETLSHHIESVATTTISTVP